MSRRSPQGEPLRLRGCREYGERFAVSPSRLLDLPTYRLRTQEHHGKHSTDSGRERTIASGDVEIAVTEFPNPGRPPVVLLHGIGSRGQSWWPVIDPLAARFHLYQLDLRGHGASGKPSAGYLMEHYAADLDAALDALDLEARSPASWATRWEGWSRSSGRASTRRGRPRWWSRIRRCGSHRTSSRHSMAGSSSPR